MKGLIERKQIKKETVTKSNYVVLKSVFPKIEGSLPR